MDINRQLRILNTDGLHARPATRFAEIANRYSSDIKVLARDKEANAKSVIELLTLGAERGTDIRIVARGSDATEAIDALEALVSGTFGEEIMVVKKGIALAPGVVIKRAYILEGKGYWVKRNFIPEGQVPQEIKRLEQAIVLAKQQMKDLEGKATTGLGHEIGTILKAHRMILQDQHLKEEFVKKIEDLKVTAEFAVSLVLKGYARKFQSMDEPYLKERVSDIFDIEGRLLENLLGGKREELKNLTEEAVLIAHDLSPSETASLDPEKIKGFATEVGGRTSHTAILARALGIPGVVGLGRITTEVYPGDTVIIDGNRGIVIIRPNEDTIQEYQKKERNIHVFEAKLAQELQDRPAETPDGREIAILGNIDFPKEIPTYLRYGARGVGLYRTEFLYLESRSRPTEEDHLKSYLKALEELGDKPIVIRTVDLGADKFYDGNNLREPNPFLGCRSIRYCFEHPEVFNTQMKAILRASAHTKNLSILFPLISSLEELRKAKAMVLEAMEELRRKGVDFNENIPIGVMIEVPSSVLIADTLAKEVDFFSIGTNDLVQYSLAIDRDNERVAYMYCPAHPAILRLLKMTIEVAQDHNIPLCLCGEMGSELEYIVLLMGLGITQFSVAPPATIPAIKKIIRSVTYERAKEAAEEVSKFTDPEKSIRFLREITKEILPEAF
jgi:phosphotransferase system enzyme I (PtsI)